MSQPLTATAASAASVDSAPRRSPRLASLDVVRGILLVVSISMDSVLPPRPDQLSHASWIGVTAIDLVFPLFVLLSGCGLAFAYHRPVPAGRSLRRVVVLLVAGLGYTAVTSGSVDPGTFRVTGPLQLYAVLVLVIAPLHLLARTVRAWVIVCVVVAGAQLALLLAWQHHCGGALSPECNPSRVIDTAVFSAAHIYRQGAGGHDPEGLVGCLGALLTACVGITAGKILLSMRARSQEGRPVASWRLPVWSVLVLAGALAAWQVLPVAKRLWTTPFALGIAAVGVAALALGHAALDRRPTRVGGVAALPLVALGRNSLLVYFGSHVVQAVLLEHGGDPSWAQRIAANVAVLDSPRATYTVLAVLTWMLLAMVLHRFKIYLTA